MNNEANTTNLSAKSSQNSNAIWWRKIAIDQLGYALNLILLLTIAAVGYWFSLVRDDTFHPGSTAKCALLIALLTFAVSALSGLLCVFNRLHDFRGEARARSNHPEAPSRDRLRGLGRATWWLFYAQWATFLFGVLALAVALLLTYGGRLV